MEHIGLYIVGGIQGWTISIGDSGCDIEVDHIG